MNSMNNEYYEQRVQTETTYMKYEDFIAGSNDNSQVLTAPLSKKHLYAIFSTAIIATSLAFFVPKVQNFNALHEGNYDTAIALDENGKVSTENLSEGNIIIDPTVSLADVLLENEGDKSLASNENVTKTTINNQEVIIEKESKVNDDLDNYDDEINEELLADADALLDADIKQKVSDVENNEHTSQLRWLVEKVQKGDTLASIFSDLNIPYTVLAAITENKEVKKELSSLQLGYNVSFLLDEDNRLIAFVKQTSKSEQIRFYRTDLEKNEFAISREKLGTHQIDSIENNAILAAATSSNNDIKKITEKSNLATGSDKADGKDTLNKDIKDTKALASSKVDTKDSSSKLIEDLKLASVDEATKVPSEDKEALPPYKQRGRLVVFKLEKGEAFSKAAYAAGLTYTEIAQITKLFKGRIQFSRHLQPGDTTRVLFSDDKGEGKINAVELKLKRLGTLSTYRNLADNKFYDESGLNSTKGTFKRFPIDGKVRISSSFNPNRRHPVTGRYRPHNGTDFAVRVGTPVKAPADGVVDKAQYSRSAGYYIVLRHAGSYSTVYMHLSKLNVKPGQRVKMGTVIARSGNTGISTGPHLHYELRINNKPVNAMRVKLPTNTEAKVALQQRKRFEANVAAFKKDLYNEKLTAKIE